MVKYVYTRRSAAVQSPEPRSSSMNRMPAFLLAALIAVVPFNAAAQDRRDRDRERPAREQMDERPRISVAEAVERASSGRPGRYLRASDRGDTIVVRWQYPGGRVADIMIDARTGRVMGER